jgi:hypothetical protein
MFYLGHNTRQFAMPRLNDDVSSWPEYKAVYLGQNTIFVTFAVVQDDLPWPEFNFLNLCCSTRWFTLVRTQVGYLGQNVMFLTFVGVQGSLPWLEYKTVYLGQNTICFTFAGVQGSFTLDGIQNC